MSMQGKWSVSSFDDRMSFEQVQIWIRKQLNREPESADLYDIGKTLYQAGLFNGAVKVLKAYSDRQGAELPGFHLLGYAYAHVGECEKSCQALIKVVNAGFDADWQLLVQMRIEADEQQTERERQNIREQYFEPIRKEHQRQQQESMERLMGSSIFSVIRDEYDAEQYVSDSESSLSINNSPARERDDSVYESPLSSSRSNTGGTMTPTKVTLKDDFSLTADLSQVILEPLPETRRLKTETEKPDFQNRKLPPVHEAIGMEKNNRRIPMHLKNKISPPIAPAAPTSQILAPLIDHHDVFPIPGNALRSRPPASESTNQQILRKSQSPQVAARLMYGSPSAAVDDKDASPTLPSIHGKLRVPVAVTTSSARKFAPQVGSVRRTLIRNNENLSSKNQVDSSRGNNQDDSEFD